MTRVRGCVGQNWWVKRPGLSVAMFGLRLGVFACFVSIGLVLRMSLPQASLSVSFCSFDYCEEKFLTRRYVVVQRVPNQCMFVVV